MFKAKNPKVCKFFTFEILILFLEFYFINGNILFKLFHLQCYSPAFSGPFVFPHSISLLLIEVITLVSELIGSKLAKSKKESCQKLKGLFLNFSTENLHRIGRHMSQDS